MNIQQSAACAAELCRLVKPTGIRDCDAAVPEDSRQDIERAIQFVECFANGNVLSWASDIRGYEDVARIYWTAREYGKEASAPQFEQADNMRHLRWWITGLAAWEAVKIVEKWAANSTAGGNAPNAHLDHIVWSLLDQALLNFETVADVVRKHRYRDALGAREPREDLRLAFEAAWDTGQHELGYQLMKELE